MSSNIKRKQLGFLSPQPYMQKAIDLMNQDNDVHAIEAKTWEEEEIQSIAAFCKEKGIDSVAGYAQKDAFHHILINEALGNPVPSRLAFFYCMNKYLMRTLESNAFFFDAVDPMNESDEEIIAKIPDTEWPFMLKNTSLSLGRGIYKIKDPEQLKEVLKSYRENTDLQESIAGQYEWYLKGVDQKDIPPVAPPFIAEHMVDMNTAIEYCYEGYIDAAGNIVHYALTEEVYFANHQALGYITPPISIDAQMADKIEAWVNDYMGRFVEVGYINQFFNLEFWIMPDGEINLTEINPRAAHSYHYNYLYSCGNSLYTDNLILAAGGTPTDITPWEKWRKNEFDQYTLIVLITGKEPGKVDDILDYDYVNYLENERDILVRHTRQRDDVIVQEDMTAAGVMLLQIWITGNTKDEVVSFEKEMRKKLYKQEQGDIGYPAYWS
ncbi:acetyl-CoA carboxylase biotin carboxylase subunit family protein [Bacteroidota bacterium]